MCPLPLRNEESERGSSDDAGAPHNILNEVLHLFTFPGCSPALQQGLDNWELCRVALSCHFALDVIYAFTE